VRSDRAYIGIEKNKPDAIAALRAATSDIEVVALEVKYPQGAEKMLIDAILDEEVPAGGLPLDIEILVNNVGTEPRCRRWSSTAAGFCPAPDRWCSGGR
jgi:electron transport complex protein RnfC